MILWTHPRRVLSVSFGNSLLSGQLQSFQGLGLCTTVVVVVQSPSPHGPQCVLTFSSIVRSRLTP